MFSSNASQVSNDVKYIEDVCSVYLRTGTGSSQTVTTGIKENTGALVISKSRSAATDWAWYDTFRGATYDLVSNSTAAQTTQSQGLTSFNADGHTWGTLAKVNTSGATYVDTVLKPTPKFFDVVTYTGNGSNMTISHNLGSVPACIFVKRTNTTGNWSVYHTSLGNTKYLRLNTTDAEITDSTAWNNTTPTSTTFTVGTNLTGSGDTYVAYLFAHNAGGFGLTGTDNVISCGSFTLTGGEDIIDLGYEPQWLLTKRVNAALSWEITDNMRGMTVSNSAAYLYPNNSNAETNGGFGLKPTATGISITAGSTGSPGDTFIYIAIRRGPMKVPTSGTSVFSPVARTGTGAAATVTGVGFPSDLVLHRARLNNVVTPANMWQDRLRGIQQYLKSDNTNQEFPDTAGILTLTMDGMTVGTDSSEANVNASTATYINYFFRRAPSFFDEVCWSSSGTGVQTITHGLKVVPELIITKERNAAGNSWYVYAAPLASLNKFLMLEQTDGASTYSSIWGSVLTDSQFQHYTFGVYNQVSYLFATCAGVSKVGSYTGNGSSQTINCGFTSGARFVLIKKSSGSGDWMISDSARGIVSGNDPYLELNNTNAEVTGEDWLDTDSTGFVVNEVSGSNANTNGATYIFLAIA